MLYGCFSQVSFSDPIADDGTFEREPSSAASARFEDAAEWSEARGGLALVVLEGERIVFERYASGYDPATPVHLFSGTKSFSCPLVLALEQEGFLTLDESVADSIPELEDAPRILIRHLLDFTSGLRDDNIRLSLDGVLERQRIDDKVAVAVSRPRDHEPGTHFAYGSVHQWVLSGLLEKKLGQPALATMETFLLGPLGLRTAGWLHDPSGQTALAYGAFTTVLEWAKFGILMRDDGVFQGERLLPAGVRDRCFTGSNANPAYGLTFWLNAPLNEAADRAGTGTLEMDGPIFGSGPGDLASAAGFKDQRLYISAAQNRVVVRFGDGNRDFKDAELVSRLFD